MERYYGLLRLAMRYLSLMGMSPSRPKLASRIINVLLITFSALMSAMMFLELFINWEGVQTFGRFLLLPGILMMLGKSAVLTTKRRKIGNLLQRVDQLWPIDIFGQTVHAEMKRCCKIGYKMMNSFTFFCGLTTLLLCLAPMFRRDLVYPVYAFCDLNTSPCYEIVYGWEAVYIILFAYPLTIANDSLFASMILYAYVAVQMVKASLRELALTEVDEASVKKHLGTIVEQHNNLLSLIQETNDVFSEILFIQFSSSLVSQILCLFMMSLEGMPPDLEHLSIYGPIYVVHLLQLAVFCIGGTLITDEESRYANTIADAAYDVAWYKEGQAKLRKCLSLIILRSQRVDKISIGDMLDLNLVSYLSIIRNSVSIYGLMQTVASSR